MKTITMLDLRLRSREMVKRLERGEPLHLTYRRKRLATLVPTAQPRPAPKDAPIRHLHKLADPTLTPMTNKEIDQLLYGEPQDVS